MTNTFSVIPLSDAWHSPVSDIITRIAIAPESETIPLSYLQPENPLDSPSTNPTPFVPSPSTYTVPQDSPNLPPIIAPSLGDSRVLLVNEETLPPVETVDFVDLDHYDGLWYEVARTRNIFELGCTCTTATYGLLSESSISVFNACNKFFTQGRLSTIAGVAEVVNPETNAELEVTFEGVPFPGDYWIIDLVEGDAQSDYTYAVVSEPSRSFVFILARTPNADPEVLDELYANLEAQFYDTDEIIRSPQNPRCDYDYSSVTNMGSDHHSDESSHHDITLTDNSLIDTSHLTTVHGSDSVVLNPTAVVENATGLILEETNTFNLV